MVGPNSSVVNPTKLVEVIAVGIVKIVDWRKDDGGGGGSWKVYYVQEGRWGSCRRRMKVSETPRTNEIKGLTVSIGSSLPENFIKGITALAIIEIGVHA